MDKLAHPTIAQDAKLSQQRVGRSTRVVGQFRLMFAGRLSAANGRFAVHGLPLPGYNRDTVKGKDNLDR